MAKKVLIVGGVAGGASTAARLRRMDESIEIVMFERGPYISFANCGLPYYIGGSIKERSSLLIQTPEAMKSRFNIDVRVENEVVGIDRERKIVSVRDVKSGNVYEESYDVLVLSPGSSPIKPKLPGLESPNIFTLWNIPDTDAVKGYLKNHKVKRATVVGGGFIGIEMIENLHELGIEVTLVEMLDQVMAPVDYEMAQIVHQHIASKGVKMYLGNGVKGFEYQAGTGVTVVELSDGTKVESDMVILSIGVAPNGQLAKAAGLEMNARGGIVVNSHLMTSDPAIYALGDAIEVQDYVNGVPTMIPLAGPANKQGRIVANNIVGREEVYEGSQGTSVAKVFDLTVASTGVNEKGLARLGKVYGKDYFVTIIQPKSHANYYPGAMPMTLKLIFDGSGKVLGAQNVGYDGVEKRIDVIATAMRFGGTVYDLKRLELAYAPPFSSAKDPVNMAGFAAENILKGDQEVLMPQEIAGLDLGSTVILDVREPIENEMGAIDGAMLIPVDELRGRLSEVPKDKTIAVYCAVGIRGYIATRILKQAGFKAKNLMGGYNLYKVFNADYTKLDVTGGGNGAGAGFVVNPLELDDDGTPEVSVDVLKKKADLDSVAQTIELDACGLQCPGPILQVYKKMPELAIGDILAVSSTDPGFEVDVKAWCKKMGHEFIRAEKKDKSFVVYLKKGAEVACTVTGASNGRIVPGECSGTDGSTMVIFSGDLDKALASLIIANGAAAMGRKVTLFFTFWGLNILRRPDKVKVSKSMIEKMFGMMMPRGMGKLKLSKMNMGGMGTAMMRGVMKNKHVNTLEELMQTAMNNGVKFVACTMSMDVMGIKQEELIDGIDFGGVASYLGAAEDATHNLFI